MKANKIYAFDCTAFDFAAFDFAQAAVPQPVVERVLVVERSRNHTIEESAEILNNIRELI